MGNVLTDKPTNFSVDNPQQIMGDSYLQTYKQRPNTTQDSTDVIPWGNGKSVVQTGVKILQSMNNGQLYVTKPNGMQVFLTSGNPPKPVPQAAKLVTQGMNYGRGPAIMLTNNPMNPKITMFTSDDSTQDRSYQPITVNNLNDFQHAMEMGQEQRDQSSGAFSGSFGQAAINPFLQRGNDFYSGLSDFARGLGAIGTQLILPIAEAGLDTLMPGAGTIIGTTGLDQGLQNSINTFYGNIMKGQKYKSGSNYNLGMSNMISDPRLQGYFQKLQARNQALGSQYGASTFTGMGQETNAQIIAKGRMMQQENQNVIVHQQAIQLGNVMGQLKHALGNKTDFDFQGLSQGLRIATTNEARMSILNHFSQQINQKLLPLLRKETAPASSSQGPAHQEAPLVQDSHGADGFAARANIINGDYYHPPDKLTIQG